MAVLSLYPRFQNSRMCSCFGCTRRGLGILDMIMKDSSAIASSSSRWIAFVVLLVGAFLPPLDFFIVNVALPSIRGDLRITTAEIELVISAYAVAYAAFLITGGRLGDLYGRRNVFLCGIAGFGASSAICGLAVSPSMLIIGRVLQGLSAAAMAPQGIASIHTLFPEHERARALGIYGATMGLAAVIAQAVGGVLIAADIFQLGWRVIFLINLPVVAAVFILGIPFLPGTRGQNPLPLDKSGVVLCTLALGLLIVPLVEGREFGWPWWIWLMLAVSPVVAMRFWRHEVALARRGGMPLISPELGQSPGLQLGLIGILFFYVVSAFFLTFSIYLQDALGVSALMAGMMFIPCGLGFFIGPLTTPHAINVFGRFVPAIGMTLEVAGCLLLSLCVALTPAGDCPPLEVVVAALGLIGFGQGWALPTLVRSVIDRAPPGGAGMISGVVSSALQISCALGIAILGGVFFSLADPVHSPASLAAAFSVTMLCIAISLIIAALLSIYASSPRATDGSRFAKPRA